jgi:hypothetical protein
MTTITIKIFALSKHDHHKVTVDPSVAVNPPAFQYFSGVKLDWTNGQFNLTDYRFKQIKDFVVTMLSSKEYPNPVICSKKKATEFADKYLPLMLKKIHDKEIEVEKTIILK